jgi:hypothetical protein
MQEGKKEEEEEGKWGQSTLLQLQRRGFEHGRMARTFRRQSSF